MMSCKPPWYQQSSLKFCMKKSSTSCKRSSPLALDGLGLPTRYTQTFIVSAGRDEGCDLGALQLRWWMGGRKIAAAFGSLPLWYQTRMQLSTAHPKHRH